MTDRVRIFNRQGDLLSEFTALVSRSWVIGAEGRASFMVSVFDDIAKETILNFGNWLLVESDLVPAWVGRIGVRQWSPRTITVTAFTPENQFKKRRGPLEQKITGSAGAIFSDIITKVNQAEPTILRIGDIYQGTSREETLNPTPMSEDLLRIYKRSKEEYQFRPVIDNGKLLIYCDWLKGLGIETGFALQEGQQGGNIETVQRILIEDEPVGNDVLGYGDGLTWASKAIGYASDEDSINKYGLIQSAKSFSGVSTILGVTNNAKEELSGTKNPAHVYDVIALNVLDTFSYMRLGNTMYLRMQNVGFTNGNIGTDKTVRIIGMYYDPEKGEKLELALQEIE